MTTCKVFVYGTLKRGQPNYSVMEMENVRFYGNASTLDKYPLIIAGRFNLPMLIDIKSEGKHVDGELYEVDQAALKRLDQFEGHPEFYTRKQIDVKTDKDNNTETCWAYFCNDYTPADLHLPHHESYDSKGDHGLEYDVSENDEHPDNYIRDEQEQPSS